MAQSHKKTDFAPVYRVIMWRNLTFRKVTHTKKSFSIVYVTPFGLYNNMYARKVNKQVTAEDLFIKG